MARPFRILRIVLGVLATLLLILGGLFLKLRSQINQRFDVVSIVQDPAYKDTGLLARAFQQPVAAAYTREIHMQDNGSRCGPASVVNVLHSLGQPGATETSVLTGSGLCRVGGLCIPGITLDELAGLVKEKTGLEVSVLRDLTLEQFRDHLRRVNDPRYRYLINFRRGLLFGKGPGHHSPIGAYLEKEDLVLVLDVNRKFGPWLVSAERLFKAMDTVDGSTGKKRGMVQARRT
jgi:hypothetical protein